MAKVLKDNAEFVSILDDEMYEETVEYILELIENSETLNEDYIERLKGQFSKFAKRQKKATLEEFDDANFYCNAHTLNKVTRFGSSLVLKFMIHGNVTKGMYYELIRISRTLAKHEYALLQVYKTKKCPNCGKYLGDDYDIECYGALMGTGKYSYCCPNCHA